ncbi:hypothetical protein [Pandoraea captiosa]|nr:hypothetical protein [Pandoraea captiosa]
MMKSKYAAGVSFFLVSAGYVLSLYGNLFKLLLLCFAAAIAFVFIWRRPSIRELKAICKAVMIVLPLYAYMELSATFTPDPALGFEYATYALVTVMPALMLGVLLGMRSSAEKFMAAFQTLVLTFLALTLVNQQLTGDPMLTAFGSIRTVFAIIFCVATPFLIGKWLSTSGRSKWIALLAFAWGMYAMRDSRSVLLLVAPIVLFMLFAYRRRLFIIGGTLAVSVAIIAAIISPLVLNGGEPPLDLGRLTSETNLDISDVLNDFALPPEQRIDFDRRLTTYTALQKFEESPWFAAGYTGVWQANMDNYKLNISAHGYTGNIGELGIAGMSIFALIVLYAYRQYRRYVVPKFRLMLRGKVPMAQTALFLSYLVLLMLGAFHQIMESVVFGLVLGLVLGHAWEHRYLHRRVAVETRAKQANLLLPQTPEKA